MPAVECGTVGAIGADSEVVTGGDGVWQNVQMELLHPMWLPGNGRRAVCPWQERQSPSPATGCAIAVAIPTGRDAGGGGAGSWQKLQRLLPQPEWSPGKGRRAVSAWHDRQSTSPETECPMTTAGSDVAAGSGSGDVAAAWQTAQVSLALQEWSALSERGESFPWQRRQSSRPATTCGMFAADGGAGGGRGVGSVCSRWQATQVSLLLHGCFSARDRGEPSP